MTAAPRSERLSYTSPPALMTGVVLSIVLMASSLFFWWALGKDVRDRVTWPQAATLLFFVLVMVAIMLSLGYSRLWANEDGVTVRNGPFLHRYRIDEVAGVRLRPGDAWSSLLIKGETELRRRPVLAIQFLEGEAAQCKVVELRRWLVDHGATSRDVDPSLLDDLGVTRPEEPEE